MAGTKITLSRRKKLQVPDDPIIPFIEGDGDDQRTLRSDQRTIDYSRRRRI